MLRFAPGRRTLAGMGQRSIGSTKRRVRWGPQAVVVVTLCFVWVAGGLRSFTWPAMVFTAVGGLAIFVVAGRSAGPSTATPANRRDLAVWALWLGAVTGWELWALSMDPRSSHPTLSSLLNNVIETHPGRSAALLVWLALGWWLARR
jgi:hypothetical protein